MQTHTHQATDKSDTIDQLNSFLRGELSAAETYRLALDRLDRSEFRPTLVQCSRSHEERQSQPKPTFRMVVHFRRFLSSFDCLSDR